MDASKPYIGTNQGDELNKNEWYSAPSNYNDKMKMSISLFNKEADDDLQRLVRVVVPEQRNI